MPFTRMAQAERKRINADARLDAMADRGWCQTLVPLQMLEDCDIPHETVSSPYYQRGPDHGSPEGVVVYAPAWVCGVWRVVERTEQWSTLESKLCETRDDLQEQDLVATELAMDLGSSPKVREAANTFRSTRDR